MLRFRGFSEPSARRKPTACEDFPERFKGLSKANVWID
jgi:hypothetical protein